MQFRCFMLLSTILALAATHPAFQHQFHNILDKQPCLKKCFDTVKNADTELSILKAANVSGYLLNLDNICNIISTSRECIAACGERSNPFTLRSMTELCKPEARQTAQSLLPCLAEEGDEIFDACKNSCGDYEAINGEVSSLTNAMRATPNDPSKVAEVLSKTNEACATLKCTNRCSVGLLSEQCQDALPDGRDVGAIVRSLIESVLIAQRQDLDAMHLTDTMAQTMPAQCNYMYIPDVMFNVTKDNMAIAAIDDSIRKEHNEKQRDEKGLVVEKSAPGEIDLSLSQIQARVLRKQLQLLDLQEKNVMKEAQKLDMEMELLRQKQISF
jgi:hypothetical protein